MQPGIRCLTAQFYTLDQLGSKGSTRLRRGERVRIETPGGGGWGVP